MVKRMQTCTWLSCSETADISLTLDHSHKVAWTQLRGGPQGNWCFAFMAFWRQRLLPPVPIRTVIPEHKVEEGHVIYSAHVTKLSFSLSVRLNETAQRQVRMHQYCHFASLNYLTINAIPFWSISENKEEREMCSVSVRVPPWLLFVNFLGKTWFLIALALGSCWVWFEVSLG